MPLDNVRACPAAIPQTSTAAGHGPSQKLLARSLKGGGGGVQVNEFGEKARGWGNKDGDDLSSGAATTWRPPSSSAAARAARAARPGPHHAEHLHEVARPLTVPEAQESEQQSPAPFPTTLPPVSNSPPGTSSESAPSPRQQQ